MKFLKDIRSLFDKNFEPSTIEIEGVELGDVKGRNVQDINPSPPDRSGEIAVITKED